MRHVPKLDRTDAARVSQAVGQLPLAVEQAAAWLAEGGMSAADYADWLDGQIIHALAIEKPRITQSPW